MVIKKEYSARRYTQYKIWLRNIFKVFEMDGLVIYLKIFEEKNCNDLFVIKTINKRLN